MCPCLTQIIRRRFNGAISSVSAEIKSSSTAGFKGQRGVLKRRELKEFKH